MRAAKKATLDALSLPTQQLLEYLTTANPQQQSVAAQPWVVYLDKPASRLTFAPQNKVITLYQMDRHAGLIALLELLKARYITVDELSDNRWGFHLQSETCSLFS